MSTRSLFLLLLVSTVARADLKWTDTALSTTVEPSQPRATAQYTFTNTGSYPIKVTDTHTSCGCTAAINDGRPVAPGQTGKIDVSFKILNRRGLYEEPILVETNDPNAKETTLTLRVLIRNPVELLPTLLFWQPSEPLAPKVIQITCTEGLTIKSIDAACPNTSVQFHLDPVKAGSEYKLTVTPKSRPLKATISVKPSIDGKPSRSLTAIIRAS